MVKIEHKDVIVRTLKEAVAELRRDPARSVLAGVEGIVVELRLPKRRTADDIFQEVGMWEGESAEQLAQTIRQGRDRGGSKEPPAL